MTVAFFELGEELDGAKTVKLSRPKSAFDYSTDELKSKTTMVDMKDCSGLALLRKEKCTRSSMSHMMSH